MKKVPKIILSRIIGLMFFLFMLYILNRFTLDTSFYKLGVTFFNKNAALLIAMSLIFMIAEIFFALNFPFNLPAPLFSSFGALLLTKFIFQVFLIIDKIILINIFSIFWPLNFIIYPAVFLLVLIGGYISIFVKMAKPKKEKSEKKKSKEKKSKESKKEKRNKEKSWDEVGEGFRKAFSDFVKKLSEILDK